jgi:hypothetical protein
MTSCGLSLPALWWRPFGCCCIRRGKLGDASLAAKTEGCLRVVRQEEPSLQRVQVLGHAERMREGGRRCAALELVQAVCVKEGGCVMRVLMIVAVVAMVRDRVEG